MKTTKLLILITFISINTAFSQESFNTVDIQEEVSKTFKNYVDHVNSKGLKGVDAYFSDDQRFFWVEDGLMQYPSKDSLTAGLNQFYPGVDSVNMEVFETSILVINQHYAKLFATYKEDIFMKSGYAFTLDGAMTILMYQQEDGWKFLSGHSSIKKPRGN